MKKRNFDELAEYNAFTIFKDDFISKALNSAIYCENRDGVKCRPLVKITNESNLREANKQIAYWKNTAFTLAQCDSKRFNPNSSIFAPIPQVILNPTEIFIRKNTAVATRKISKDDLINRLVKKRSTLVARIGAQNYEAEELMKEIKRFRVCECEEYRVRGAGYTDYILLYKLAGSEELHKIRISKNGLFFYDPKNTCRISYPEDSRMAQRTRNDQIYNDDSVKPINCSLYNGTGTILIKESDALKLRKNMAKNAKTANKSIVANA